MKVWIFAVLALGVVMPGHAKPAEKPPGAVSCIDPHDVDSRTAEGDDVIVFRSNNRAWRNHLHSVCPGLSRLNNFGTLVTEPTGGQLCEGDTVRVADPDTFHALGIRAAPRCVLGWFEPVSPKP